MSAVEEHRTAMLRELALVDSAILEAGKLRATGDLALAADALLKAASCMLHAARHQTGFVRARIVEGLRHA